MTAADDNIAKLTRLSALSQSFTPSAPVSTLDLFAGRFDQIVRVLSAISQPGRHPVLYGERGVGKTSLANLLSQLRQRASDDTQQIVQSTRVNCSTSDSFKSIWTRVFRDLDIEIPGSWAYGSPEPDEIRTALGHLQPPRVVILDELDRWEDDEGLSLTADLIKSMADHVVPTKIVLVGVADSIDELVGEHESIQRNIEQVPMPRMTPGELSKIPLAGFERLDMTVADDGLALMVNLSEGLPHYAHYFSLHAGQRAIQDDRSQVEVDDVLEAVKIAVATHTVLSEYKRAVHAQRIGTLHERVLLACALARKDELGYFTAGDVREPMSAIMGSYYDIPAFSPHLKAFTELERGPVLRREGPERKYRYRFRNPLIQPFAVLQGLSRDDLPEQYRKRLFAAASQDPFADVPSTTSD